MRLKVILTILTLIFLVFHKLTLALPQNGNLHILNRNLQIPGHTDFGEPWEYHYQRLSIPITTMSSLPPQPTSHASSSSSSVPSATTMKTKKKLYFAYGSNLSLSQMISRCPTSRFIALARLPGYAWIIGERGYANVVKSPLPHAASGGEDHNENQIHSDDFVMGMLYELEQEDERQLDRAEGVPVAYVKEMCDLFVVSAGDPRQREVVSGLVYVDVVRKGVGVCKEEYVARMNRGIRDMLGEAEKISNKAKEECEAYVKRYLRPFVRDENVPDVVDDPFHPSKKDLGYF